MKQKELGAKWHEYVPVAIHVGIADPSPRFGDSEICKIPGECVAKVSERSPWRCQWDVEIYGMNPFSRLVLVLELNGSTGFTTRVTIEGGDAEAKWQLEHTEALMDRQFLKWSGGVWSELGNPGWPQVIRITPLKQPLMGTEHLIVPTSCDSPNSDKKISSI